MSILIATGLLLSPTLALGADEDAEGRALLEEMIATHEALDRGVYEASIAFTGDNADAMGASPDSTTMIAFVRGDDGEDTVMMRVDGEGGEVVTRPTDDGGLEAWIVADDRVLVATPDEVPMLKMQLGFRLASNAHRPAGLDEALRALGVETVERDGETLLAIAVESTEDAQMPGAGTLYIDPERKLMRRMEQTSEVPDLGEISMAMSLDWIALGDDVDAALADFAIPDDAERVDFEFDATAMLAGMDIERPASDEGPNVGSPLPDFELRTADGEVFDNESLAGKVAVLDFWATWCGPCLMAMPGIEAVWDEYRGGDDVLVLGMNVFERGDPAAVMAEEGFTYPNLLDADAVAEALGYTSIPQVVVVDQDGVIRHELRGYSPDHERDLRSAVEELLGAGGDDASAEAFPDFSLRSVDGGSLALDDLRGKVAVFDFWATWCGPCVRAMPGMQHLHETLGASSEVAVIGMNVSERGDPAALLAEKGITYTNLLEADAVAEALGIMSIPEVVVVDREGRIVERITGFVEGHEEKVAAAIRAAMR